jgi:hypothetical protein
MSAALYSIKKISLATFLKLIKNLFLACYKMTILWPYMAIYGICTVLSKKNDLLPHSTLFNVFYVISAIFEETNTEIEESLLTAFK